MEPIVSACANAIDPLVLQCLKEWNGANEIVKKYLVILLLYVATEAHDYASSHSQLTDLTSAPSWTLIGFCTLIQKILLSPTLSHPRVWAFWGHTA